MKTYAISLYIHVAGYVNAEEGQSLAYFLLCFSAGFEVLVRWMVELESNSGREYIHIRTYIQQFTHIYMQVPRCIETAYPNPLLLSVLQDLKFWSVGWLDWNLILDTIHLYIYLSTGTYTPRW